MVVKVDVFWSETVASDELLVSGRPLVLGIARQHALEAHAYALDVLDRTPALVAQEIEAYDAVGINVRMHGNRAVGLLDEGYFWWFWTVLR